MCVVILCVWVNKVSVDVRVHLCLNLPPAESQCSRSRLSLYLTFLCLIFIFGWQNFFNLLPAHHAWMCVPLFVLFFFSLHKYAKIQLKICFVDKYYECNVYIPSAIYCSHIALHIKFLNRHRFALLSLSSTVFNSFIVIACSEYAL